MKRLIFAIAFACVIAATIGAVAIGLSLFTQPEAYAALSGGAGVTAGIASPIA